MKETTVEIGKVYALRSETGGEVTDENGKILETLEPNVQVRTMAQEQKWLVPDDCKVTKGNFKRALAALFLLGGGGKNLPTGYTRLEYLETIIGKDHINTGIVPGGKILSAEVDACILESGTDVAFLLGSVANVSRDEFRIGLFNGKKRVKLNSSAATGSAFDISRKSYYINRPQGSGVGAEVLLSAAPVAIADSNDRQVYLFRSNAAGYTNGVNGNDRSRKRIYGCKIWDGDEMVGDYLPALDPAGVPCMFDTVSRKPHYNAGTGQFITGMTLNQVRGLHLPAGGGELTLSLPHEASIDKLAQAALERARANGWVLTLQYAEAEVPAGYRKLDFLESTGTQQILLETLTVTDTDVITWRADRVKRIGTVDGHFSDVNCTVRFYHNYDWNRSNADFLKNGGLYDNIVPLVFSGEWELRRGQVTQNGTAYPLLDATGSVTGFSVFAQQNAAGRVWPSAIKLYSWEVAGKCRLIPALDPTGAPCMYDTVTGTMKVNVGTGAFIAGLATVADVRSLWLPEAGGPLTVSVPADTPDSAVEQLRKNNPTRQIAIQYRTDDNEN